MFQLFLTRFLSFKSEIGNRNYNYNAVSTLQNLYFHPLLNTVFVRNCRESAGRPRISNETYG